MKPTELSQSEPKLQPPGAGLSLSQMIFIRAVMGPVISKIKSRQACRKEYELLTTKLIEKISAISEDKRKIKVLVGSIVGLEDSSRYWSLNGVLEHLLIVSKAMESVILSLSSGTVPDGKADTAKVKPTGSEQSFLAEFGSYAPGLMKSLDAKLTQPGMNFKSSLKFRHPWFGPITARQWYWLLGSHTGIHYRQAKEIIRGL